MSRDIRLDSEAIDEIAEAARYYEERDRGRGDHFADTVFARINTLSRFPNAGAPVVGAAGAALARQVRLGSYPYLVVYAVSDKEIRVVAVAHERQTPAYWAARLPATRG